MLSCVNDYPLRNLFENIQMTIFPQCTGTSSSKWPPADGKIVTRGRTFSSIIQQRIFIHLKQASPYVKQTFVFLFFINLHSNFDQSRCKSIGIVADEFCSMIVWEGNQQTSKGCSKKWASNLQNRHISNDSLMFDLFFITCNNLGSVPIFY